MSVTVIVDDRGTNRHVLRLLAENIEPGMRGVTFGAPMAALDYLSQNPADLIVTDFNMPGMQGDEFIRECRKTLKDSDVPILVVTAYADKEYRYRALNSGATDFLLSPIDHAEFRIRCTNSLRLARQHKETRKQAESLASDLRQTLMRQATREAQKQKMVELGLWTGGIAHDLNGFVGIIEKFSAFLLKDLAAGTQQHQYASAISKGAQQLKSLVSNILAYSRQDKIETRQLGIADIVDEAVRTLQQNVPSNSTLVAGDIDRDLTIYADKTQLFRVIVNLVRNAFDAFGENEGVVRVEGGCMGDPVEKLVSAALLDPDHTFQIGRMYQHQDGSTIITTGTPPSTKASFLRVADNGCGMGPEIARRIFEPFFTTKPEGTGTGLGLALVHNIVSSYGGMLVIQTAAGKGTTVEVLFPMQEDSNKALMQYLNGPIHNEDRQNLGREDCQIMIIDDDDSFRFLLETVVSRVGHGSLAFSSPVVAWEEFQKDPTHWQLVISDQTMPTMQGAELLTKMRGLRSDLPCLLCSGQSRKSMEFEVSRLPGALFLNKGADMDRLEPTIRGLLGGV